MYVLITIFLIASISLCAVFMAVDWHYIKKENKDLKKRFDQIINYEDITKLSIYISTSTLEQLCE